MTDPVETRSRLRSLIGSALRKLRLRSGPTLNGIQGRLDHQGQAIHDITAALVAAQRSIHLLEDYIPELLGLFSSTSGTQRRTQRILDDLASGIDRHSATLAAHQGGIEQNGVSILEMWGGIEQHGVSILEMWERLEFVRRELMFEVRYSPGTTLDASGNGPARSLAEAPRVADAARITELSLGAGLRLNLGCGHLPREGFINVDMRELTGVDVVAPVDDLPFETGSIDEIHSSHLLEHFPQEQLIRQLLPYWFSMLRPGGTFRAVVPDGVGMVEGFVTKEIPFAVLREVLYGGQEYEGDFHFTMFSGESLAGILTDAGFVDVEIEVQGRVNDVCIETQVAARRPA
jgi:hypothetical protein